MPGARKPKLHTPFAVAALVALALIAILAAVASAGYGPKIKPNLKSKRVLATKNLSISGSDDPQRFEVYCPKGKRPLGGGAMTSPVVNPAVAGGAFPTSYERLGVQEGWHITISQVRREGSSDAQIQVLCRSYKGNLDPVEHFVKSQDFKNIQAGETKRFTETCPGKKKIISGGFLTSQLFNNKGAYVTESRMVGNNGWTVLAHAVEGGNGSQISAVAYCTKSKKTLIKEVAGPETPVTAAATITDPLSGLPILTVLPANGTSTAPGCPGKSKLIAGGFSAQPGVLPFDGSFAGLDTWKVSGAPYTGSGSITALGYCL